MSHLIPKEQIKILIIDDEQGIRDVLCQQFADLGYTVAAAANGQEAVEKASREKFNLAVCDLKMPKWDGIRTLKELKKVAPHIEVIMATAYGNIETAVQSIKMGAYDFIQKPFNLDEISALAERALEKAELKIIAALYETSKILLSRVRLEDLLPELVPISLKFLNADQASFMLFDENQKLYVAASSGLEDPGIKNLRISLGERVAGKVAQNGAAVIISGPLKEDERFQGLEGNADVRSSIIAPLLSSNGQILGVFSVARIKKDVPFEESDQKSLEVFLSQIGQAIENIRLYRELEDKIEDLNRAYAKLSDMQEELIHQEKLAAIGELASGVAHELNNPLTAIIGLTDLLLEGDGQKEEDRKDFTTIRFQADRCRKIILNLMHFARKHKTEKKEVRINDVIRSSLELAQYDFKSGSMECDVRLDEDLPPILADSYQLQQVFLNIMNNARHAMEGKTRPRLVITSRREDSKVSVGFEDNGCGMSREVLTNIFMPFFTTKEVGKGTGLGLSVSYGIVREHGGEIRVQSEPGKGSRFFVELPAVNSQGKPRAKNAAPENRGQA